MSSVAVQAKDHQKQGLSSRIGMRKLGKVSDIAELLDVKEHRVYDLVRRDLIPHVKMGRQVRFDLNAVERWVASGGEALPGGWRQEPKEAA